jgi:putative RNA ligase
VVRQLFTDTRIKIKQEDYVALHRIITGCTKRRLWECLVVWAHNDMPDEFLVRRFYLSPARVGQIRAMGQDWLVRYLEGTPEEFRDWVVTQTMAMQLRVQERQVQIRRELRSLCEQLGVEPGDNPSREDSARLARLAGERYGTDRAMFNLVMTLWRGQEITSSLWRELYPEHELPYRAAGEEVA